jgi:predicted TIM-barrel fold metal-dependent hydrolase
VEGLGRGLMAEDRSRDIFEQPGARSVRVGDHFDTRDALRNARRQAEERGLDDILVVDVDAHHYETESWGEIAAYLDDPVLQHYSSSSGLQRLNGQSPFIPTQIGNQDVSGRILRYPLRRLEQVEPGEQRDTVLVRRAMEMIGIDYQIVFPTPMLALGLHPVPEVEATVARAYARWITERVCAHEPSIKTMLYLPFNDPDGCVKLVEEFADAPGVVGFMVTSVRYRPVHHNSYMPLYRAIEETGLPLGFHAGFTWTDRTMEQLNKFISVHALGFTVFNMVHLTNWVINGLPERFPGLDVVWIESGLAWLPFLMQRLDSEYMLRSSEAPLLTRRPSEYIREMYFTSQPMESADRPDLLEMTFDVINARTQLMYSSDYPHWDFDLPSVIHDLPFLDEGDKRAILGENAKRLFKLDPAELGNGRRGTGAARPAGTQPGRPG